MKRITSTLRGRIVFAAALSTAVVLIGVGALVLAGTRRDARTDLDRRLQNRAAAISKLPSVRAAVPNTDPLGDLTSPSLDFGVRVVLRGKVIGADGTMPSDTSSYLPHTPGIRTIRAAGFARSRAATVQVAGRPRLLVEASGSLSSINGTVRSMRRRIVLVGLLGLLVAVGLATLAANYAVRSLSRLRAAADQVADTERLDLRIPEDGPDEVHAVAHALNAMLGRLEQSAATREQALAATRQFAADAGPEPRTPLAVLQTGLETLARNPDLPANERTAILVDTLAEHERLVSLVTALQALTRGDGGAMGDETAVDVGEIVAASIRAVEREAPAARVTADVATVLPSVVASPVGLRLLVDNLLQNAARHGGVDGAATIRVSAWPTTLGVELVVEDDGPGIPEADRVRVTERFVRGAASSTEGSGLGLAIALQQAQRLGGTLAIEASASGGARLVVTLPAAAVRGPAS